MSLHKEGQLLSIITKEKISKKKRAKGNWSYIDGRSLYRGEDWAWARKLTLIRDDYTCQSCGTTKKSRMFVHHVIPYIVCHDNRLTNLICLCHSCHTRIEFGKLCLLLLPINIENQKWEKEHTNA